MDGLGDLPNPSLNNKTPLQYSNSFYLKKLAKEGETGLITIIKPGVVPGSDTAHLSLFGYDPNRRCYYSKG